MLADPRHRQRPARASPTSSSSSSAWGARISPSSRATSSALGIDAEFESAGESIVALEPHELADLEEEAELVRRFGYDAELLDSERVRAEVHSPSYLGGLWIRTGSALVHPGKLADGLRAAAARAGVRDLRVQPGPRAGQDR